MKETPNKRLLHLQNGSDIRGVALATEGGPAVRLTPEAANTIAAAFGIWLEKRTGKPADALCVGVGHDSRLTAQTLKQAIIEGLSARDVHMVDCGLASSPAMFMGTIFKETKFDGSIMITASHLPKNRNGMKFFVAEGGLDAEDITEILQTAATLTPAAGTAPAEASDLMERYCAFLREKITNGVRGRREKPLEYMHIIVDAGNGAGGFFVKQVLEPLGADCTGSQFLEPDGTFPNHPPNPENPKAMRSVRKAVYENQADIGIIFDTDVDRMSAVLMDGSVVNRDSIIALMSAIIAPEHPGGTIVTDSVTSDRLTRFLEGKLKLKHRRFKRGYKNVINEAMRLNAEGTDTPLAMETSGHGAMKENYFLDDGAYMAVKLCIAATNAKSEGNSMLVYLEGFEPPAVEYEVRIPIMGEGYVKYGKAVLEAFEKRAQEKNLRLEDTCEGVRISFPGRGWLLLRLSLHDPLLPLNVEGKTKEDGWLILDTVYSLLQDFDRLDLSGLNK